MRWWRYRWFMLNPYFWRPWMWMQPFQCPACDAVLPGFWAAAAHVEIRDFAEKLDG